MKSWLYPFYQMGLAGVGNMLSLLIIALIAAALFAVVYIVLSRSFLRIVTQNRGQKKAVYREKTVKAAGVKSALLRRELKRFTSSSSYMLNCGLVKARAPSGSRLLLTMKSQKSSHAVSPPRGCIFARVL